VRKLVSIDGVVTGKLSKSAQNFTRLTVSMGNKVPALYSLSLVLTKISKPFAYFIFRPWFYNIRELPYEAWVFDRHMALNKEIAHSTPKAWDGLNAADLTPLIKNISASTMIIFGKQDATVPVSQARVFKEQLPAARLVLIENCGHFPMYEKFDEYIKAIKEFLQKQE
jgi:pimeloyl-ACP methyl ester carboxylesterase